MHVLTQILFAFIEVSALNIRAEERGTCSKVVYVLEADPFINSVWISASQCIIHACSGLAALMTGNAEIRIIRQEVAIGIRAAKAYRFSTWEEYRIHTVALSTARFAVTGCTHEAIASRHGAQPYDCSCPARRDHCSSTG